MLLLPNSLLNFSNVPSGCNLSQKLRIRRGVQQGKLIDKIISQIRIVCDTQHSQRLELPQSEKPEPRARRSWQAFPRLNKNSTRPLS